MTARALAAVATALAVLAVTAVPSPAAPNPRAPSVTAVRCVPATAPGCRPVARVAIGQQVQLRGRLLRAGMRVTFRWRQGALATRMRRSRIGWVARVPPGTRPGRVAITLRDRAGRRSNRRYVVVTAVGRPAPRDSGGPGDLPAAFRGNGMWIWQVSRSERGNVAAIAERARAAGMSTVFVKSADGVDRWDQFTPQLVQTLHAAGLQVCAWQFVYGSRPEDEARVGASAATAGADCLVIDAESHYEGRYSAASRYMAALRTTVGPSYPVGLTSFPYVDYHRRLPYSVFLGPGASQANLPQVYWKDIGGTVDAVSARTYAHNRIYRVPIAPLGQAYNGPTPSDLQRFRDVWAGYGAGGVSWWSWQAAGASTWATLTRPAPRTLAPADPGWPALDRSDRGDQVVWLQQHLASADPAVAVDGRFSTATETALRALQAARGLPVTGETDAATWQAVLALAPRVVDWSARSAPAG